MLDKIPDSGNLKKNFILAYNLNEFVTVPHEGTIMMKGMVEQSCLIHVSWKSELGIHIREKGT